MDTPGFNHIVANAVFANLATKNLFSELRDRMFDVSEEENHIHSLTKTISLYYIRIKMFHEGKKITETLINVEKRKKLSRLPIFLNV